MSNALESASFYKKAVETFGLPAEKADKIAAQMAALGVARDDAYMLLFLATGRVEAIAEGIPEEMRTVLRQGIAGVRKSIDDGMASLPSRLGESFDGHMAKVASSLSETVTSSVDAEVKRRAKVTLGGFALGAALLVAVAVGGGYVLGRDSNADTLARWATLADMRDGKKWLALADANDLSKALAQGCSSDKLRMVGGARTCNVPLYLERPAASASGSESVTVTIWEWLYAFNPLVVLGAGAVLGFFGRGWLRPRPAY